ncbi:MAG: DUF885 family protein [Nitrospirae bacterium]|nr:DUF885 family protein [Nitrospirota bacterium]
MKQLILAGLICISVMVVACSAPPPEESLVADLHALFDEAWDFQMQENPMWATAVGIHDYNDRLPSFTIEDEERRAEYYRGVLDRLHAIDRDGLEAAERINYDMFERRLSDWLTGFEFKEYLIPITAEGGFHTGFARLPERVPLSTAQDYENYIARLHAFPLYAEQHIEIMREGIANGYVLPRVVLEGYESTIEPHLVDDTSTSVFWKPFESFPNSVPEAEHERLRQAGLEAIRDDVIPAYRAWYRFILDEYIPSASPIIGASELPNGREYYEYLVRHHTTLDITPQEVHDIGLAEVARIRAEMEAIIEEVEFQGTFAEFLDFLRTDPQFFVDTPEELLMEASFIAKTMDGKLPTYFKTLPRLPYGVAPVPDHIAPKYTAGRYVGAPLGSKQPGYYWVNTYALESRPLWALPALTLHEAVPGHHLQNALRQELEGLPNFRRFSGINAYGEGWGLYCEKLGVEAGMYTTPYEHFGRLTYEMWRAARLVVDTGMHYLGWSRQQGLDFLAENTALSLHEIKTETDRYISWPGQALAYKMGEIKIWELRRRAEEALGEDFDIREFHEVILMNGPVPLTVLEDQIDALIENRGVAG